MTMTIKISLVDINHLNTTIGENKAENNNVVNEQETIENNKVRRYRTQLDTNLKFDKMTTIR